PAAPADDVAESFRLLTPPAASRREARPASPGPATPATTPAAAAPAAATEAEAPEDPPEEATDWYQPTVASTMPYEFPSTGSGRLPPPPGRRGPGARPTPPAARPPAPPPSTGAPPAGMPPMGTSSTAGRASG